MTLPVRLALIKKGERPARAHGNPIRGYPVYRWHYARLRPISSVV